MWLNSLTLTMNDTTIVEQYEQQQQQQQHQCIIHTMTEFIVNEK